MDTLAAERTGVEPCHRGRNTAFVKEDQLFRRDRPDLGGELFAVLEVGFCVAFVGVE